MATSGTTNFSLNVEELISRALDKVGGEITSGIDLRRARTALNLLLIDVANRGIPLAEIKNKTLTLVEGTSEYTLPTDVNDVLSMVLTRDDNDTPVTRLSISEFHKISNKSSEGMPTQYMLDRQRTAPVLTLYLTPDNSTDVINYWCSTRVEDAGAYADTPDMSVRYFPALVFGLAYFVSFDREGFDPAKRRELLDTYIGLLDNATLEDRERVSIKVAPFDYRSR